MKKLMEFKIIARVPARERPNRNLNHSRKNMLIEAYYPGDPRNRKISLERMISDAPDGMKERTTAWEVRARLGKQFVCEKHIKTAMEYYEREGFLEDAAKVAEKSEHFDLAVLYYCKRREYESVKRVVKKSPEGKEALMHIIEAYENGEEYYTAAEIAQKTGLHILAIRNYLRAGQLEMAEYIAKYSGNVKKLKEFFPEAIEIQVKEGKTLSFLRAAKMAEKLGRYGDAINYYLKYGSDITAADVARKHGFKEKADKLYGKIIKNLERSEEYGNALEFARKAGFKNDIKRLTVKLDIKKMKAVESYGNFKEAIKYAEKLGMNERAELYRKLLEPISMEPKKPHTVHESGI